MAFEGKVQSFNHAKGSGIITTEYGDLFLPLSSCQDGTPMVGDSVKFDLEDNKEQPLGYQAASVTGCTGAKGKGKGGGACNGGGATAGQKSGTGQFTGTVKQYNYEKGYGFVIEPDGNSLFIHAKQFVDGSIPKAGDFLTFDKTEDERKPGTMQACNITGGTGVAVAKGAFGPAQNFGGKGGPYANANNGGKMQAMMGMMQMMMGMMGGSGGSGGSGGMGGMGGGGGNDTSWSAGGGDASWTAGGGDASWSAGGGEASWPAGGGDASWSGGGGDASWSAGGGDASWSAGGGDASWSGGAGQGGDASWSVGGCGANAP